MPEAANKWVIAHLHSADRGSPLSISSVQHLWEKVGIPLFIDWPTEVVGSSYLQTIPTSLSCFGPQKLAESLVEAAKLSHLELLIQQVFSHGTLVKIMDWIA